MRAPGRVLLRALVMAMMTGAVGAAETPLDRDLETARMRRLGPFHLKPFFALKDVGYDDNIRLEAPEPEGDMTATAGAGFEAVLLTGDRGGVRFHNVADYVAFAQNTDLNHWNGESRTRGVLLLKSLSLSLEDNFSSVRERPNTEVDLRLRREGNAVTTALATRSRGRAGLTAYLRGERIDYSGDEGAGEAEAARLDRDERSLAVAGDLRIRPKTSLLVEGAVRRIEFVNNVEGRDSREVTTYLGLRFDPSAALQGWFRIGRSNMTLKDRPEDDFHGTVGEGQLATRLGRFARLKGTVERGLEFSTLASNTYYIMNLWSAAYEHFFSRRLSGELYYGEGKNEYPHPVTRASPAPAFQGVREDRLFVRRVGVRYRLGEQMDVAVRVARTARDSTDDYYDRTRNVYTFGTTYSF